jgi:hypothetical protein
MVTLDHLTFSTTRSCDRACSCRSDARQLARSECSAHDGKHSMWPDIVGFSVVVSLPTGHASWHNSMLGVERCNVCALHNVCRREPAECGTCAWRFVFAPRCIATHVSPVPLTRTPRIPHLPLQLHIREHVLQCSVQRLHGRGGKTTQHITFCMCAPSLFVCTVHLSTPAVSPTRCLVFL